MQKIKMRRFTVLRRFASGCPFRAKRESIIIKRYVRKPRCAIGIENISEYFDELTTSQFIFSDILQKLSYPGIEITLRCRFVSSADIITPISATIIIVIYCHFLIILNT